MVSVDESLTGRLPFASTLVDGMDVLDQEQVVSFTQYVRVVLPLDGFVYWVRADLLSQSALANALRANGVSPNTPPTILTPAATISQPGSLHYASLNNQLEDETFALNRVVFTSQDEVQFLNNVGPNVIYIATFNQIRFAFSRRDSFYVQSGLHHYGGDAVYPALETQLVDSLAGFDAQSLVVSNSLPFWLGMQTPTSWPWLPGISTPVYPSFLVPANIPPVYAVAHISSDSTQAIQSAPWFDTNTSEWQLTKETVRITLYGFRNLAALNFRDYVLSYAETTELFGVTNMPIIRDEKRTQIELGVIAMKKTIEFEINYYQAQMRTIARLFVKSCLPTYNPTP